MRRLTGLGVGLQPVSPADAGPDARSEFVLIQQPLQRILAFTRRSIDDVVNDPIAKNEVLGYFKLTKQIHRSVEVRELERQWNSVGAYPPQRHA
jgi:hypothetical protein